LCGGTVIDLGGSNQIALAGVSSAALTAACFQFVA